MKLKLAATIKKEALLPGMEQAVQDINLQKELNKPGVVHVQQVNMSDQTAVDELRVKYPRKGGWNGGDLEKDIKSYMEKFHPGKPYGIGVEKPNALNDEQYQREMAIDAGHVNRVNMVLRGGYVNTKTEYVGGRLFFYDAARNIYALVY